MNLSGKTAIVTGAGSGFGAGIAARLAQEGANVVVADLNERGGAEVAETIMAAGGNARFVKADVSRGADMAGLLAAALAAFGGVQVVVNNAGVTHRRQPICDVSEAEFDRLFAVNVKSLFHAAKVFVPYFRGAGGGSFINIASIVSFRPSTGLAWYNGTKAAVVNISKSMAVDFGHDNIRVNCVNPAIGDTGLLGDFLGEPDTPELRQRLRQLIPLGRFTTARDVAGACVYLASDDAAFVTGTCIEVDGGRSI